MDLILIPAILHIDTVRFWEYPPALQVATRSLLMHYIAGGQLDLAVVRRGDDG